MPVVIRGNAHKLARSLVQVSDRAQDLRPAWLKVGKYISSQTYEQFRSAGKKHGTPWKPLTREYAFRKRAAGFSGGILVRKGGLRRSFLWPDLILTNKKAYAEFGSELDTAKWHQYGTRKDGKQINPPRPMLVVTPLVRRRIARLVAEHIVEVDLK